MRTLIPLSIAILLLAACSGDAGLKTAGSESGDLSGSEGAVPFATSDYMALEISSGNLTALATEPDLSGSNYRADNILFRRVTTTGDHFLISVFEITQQQWTNLGGNTPWTGIPVAIVPASSIGANYPAYGISYTEISTTLSAYESTTGITLNIPNGSEWGYAVNAGGQDFFWGNDDSRDTVQPYALTAETADGNNGPRPVGEGTANNIGIYDIHGNVWEWAEGGEQIHGGSWYESAYAGRASNAVTATEGGLTDDAGHALFGARLVLRP